MTTPPPETSNIDILSAFLIKIYKALGAVDNDSVLQNRATEHIKRNWDPLAVNRQIAAVAIGEYCDRRPKLGELDIPVLVIHGDLALFLPLEAGKEVAESIPNSELCIISGMGHDNALTFVDQIVESINKIATILHGINL